ncbi:cyanobactin maturation protease PatG family protein [Streptomyces wuyuanensis]|uniref:cyanobactin maturation protease PatG family protein n=1 Tax=Streptomyces wuyuanensis TaxID=1196353 RepID=UPI003676D08F
MHVRSVLQGLPHQDELLGDPEVCIAVLDGPVDFSHPCFAGADLTRLDTLVQDPAGQGAMSMHGTHVASLLFGQPGSSVVGMAPRCRGLILPVFRDSQDWRVPQLDLTRAIERAAEAGAHIINISGGELTPDGRADAMLERALRSCADNGVLVVAAVGNDGCDCLQAPAATPSVLAVGAAGPNGEPTDMNNWGAAYGRNGVLAPGQAIEGAAPGGGRVALTGSSFATPVVSGVAALLVAEQLRQGQEADPIAAGKAVLKSATSPPCSPADAPECRRHLAGNLHAAGAYSLIRRGGLDVPDLDAADRDARPISSHPAKPQVLDVGANSSRAGVSAAGEPSSLETTHPEPNEGISAMDTRNEQAHAGGEADTAGGKADAAGLLESSAPSETQEAEPTSPEPGISAADEPASLETTHPQANDESYSMDTQTANVIAPEGTATSGAAPAISTPVTAPVPQPVGHAPTGGVRPSCGGIQSSSCQCGGIRPSGCQCGVSASGVGRQPIYAIGTIGFDYQTEARRDYFRQQMPMRVLDSGTEVPPNIYDPRQLHDFLADNPWETDKLTWTLTMDSTPVYALEAELPVGMDWHQAEPRLGSRGPSAPSSEGDSGSDALGSQGIRQSPFPTYRAMSHVYKIFLDAIRGQVQKATEDNYVSRVSIPGELTGRTTRLYSGQEVPVVKVRGSGNLALWNEGLLVNKVVNSVMEHRAANPLPEGQQPPSEDQLKVTIRALFDKVYWQFRNLGQSSADRALNAAGTNAFAFGTEMGDGLLSARHVPGESTNFYVLDTISVSKSPFCRPGSDCQDVVLRFFDPENDRRANVSYLFTFDVSDEPVSLAPVHKFIGS